MSYLVINILLCCLPIRVGAYKPHGKREQVVWRLECELGIIADPECPVDGGWTPWSPWSACRGSCVDIGHRSRIRECANPLPSQDGLPCSGVDQEIEPCYLKNCTIQDYYKIVEGDAIRTETLHQLEAVPALMERCLLMQCPYEAVEAALTSDNTWQINPESLWNSLQCVKHNLGCPVVGEWGAWGAWSACGARCGYGLRWRLRRCDTPPPSNVQLVCSGTPLQADECQGDQCALNKRDYGGTWSEWGKWSLCSENCGTGVRRRKRTCFEMNTPRLFGSWGTHCRGQHDQLEVCESRECDLDGGWSGWGTWGPCSQSCGAGRRSRSRSCTRPVPAGNGALCSGPRTEVGSCHLNPCESYSHTVAVFNGESFLQYNFENKRSTLLHFYVRFLPLSPHGTIVRRGSMRNPLIRLSLQKWHICLDASGKSQTCTIPRICSHTAIEPAVWHSALITLTSAAATLRLDDAPERIRSTFPCDPDLPDEKINIYIGERLHGEIQEVILNFIPLSMIIERSRSSNSSFCPSTGSNVAYEKTGLEEAYLKLNNDQYLRLPCYSNQEEWQTKLTLKSKKESGTILFLQNELENSWLHLSLQNMRLKLKLAFGDFRSESSSFSECLPDQWFDVRLSKKPEANNIEASINARERLHVLVDDITYKKSFNIKGNHENKTFTLCADEYFLGGVPIDIRQRIPEDFNTFTGVIASMSVNGVLQNLHDISKERYKDGKIQVSSRTASISGSYHETAWGRSNILNLTCLHARIARSPNKAHWMYLDDIIMSDSLREKAVRSTDNGRVLRLMVTADNDLRGFYTCRAHYNKRTRNIVTYGVLGITQHKLTGPDMTTAIAVITSLALVLGSLVWLFVEGIHDLRNGYGFFRDAHLSPEEEAEAVCKYIDQNIHLVGSKSAAKIAKARARRIGRQLASRASFAAQEPQGLMQAENISSNEPIPSELEVLPALPEVKSCGLESTHNVFRCEQSYVSSTRPRSLTSPRSKLTSSTSSDMLSPKALCSKLLLTKQLNSSRDTVTSRKHVSRIPRQVRSKLLTIKSSSFAKPSLAQSILQKFRELKSEDP